MEKMRIKKGDTVAVISGEERPSKGKYKKGKVLAVLPKENRILVEGVNIATKHKKARSAKDPGGIIKKEIPMSASNVMAVCPGCDKPTRIGFKIAGDGTKMRICKKCGEPFKK